MSKKSGVTWTEDQYREFLARTGQSATTTPDTQEKPAVEDTGKPGTRKGGRSKTPNKTESEFMHRLEAMKLRGDIKEYGWEAVTLRLADRCTYCPDFPVIVSGEITLEGLKLLTAVPVIEVLSNPVYEILLQKLRNSRVTFCEVKGGHLWDDAKVKWRTAAEKFPWATWEMHQKKNGEWREIMHKDSRNP